jgi:HK97 family phage major capsid protein
LDYEIKELLVKQGEAFEEFKKVQDGRIENLESALNDFAKKAARPRASYDDGGNDPEAREHKQAFLGYMRSGRERELESKARAIKSMSICSDPDGGYLAPAQIDSVITKALRELSPMRQLARVVQIATGDYSMLHSVGGTAYSWVGEKTDRPQTDGARFMELKPAMGEIYASPAVTQRLLDDNSFDLENWLIDELTEAFGEGEGVAFITGNGV